MLRRSLPPAFCGRTDSSPVQTELFLFKKATSRNLSKTHGEKRSGASTLDTSDDQIHPQNLVFENIFEKYFLWKINDCKREFQCWLRCYKVISIVHLQVGCNESRRIASRSSFQKSPLSSHSMNQESCGIASKVRLKVLIFFLCLDQNGGDRSIENIFLL